MSLPRVLIFEQTFNNKYGGGITISNLFRGWDKDRIAVAATGHMMYGVTTDICSTYYQLGYEEFRWRFPFNLIQKEFPSGLKSFDNKSVATEKNNKASLRFILVNKVLYSALKWLGLFHSLSKIKMSAGFEKWLSEFKPEILYLQVSTREAVLFAQELHDYLKIPAAIHMMDDWPSIISNKGPFKKFWRKKIDGEFRQLLDRVDICLSISDAMSKEYLKRYNRTFHPFHNPVEVKKWQAKSKSRFKLDRSFIDILYSGRIGPGITESLLELADAIDLLNSEGKKIKLSIQSPSRDDKIIKRLQKYGCIRINPIAEYSDLPAIFSKADILAIVNDFDKQGIEFLKYSMPTKASEYMISGTPVLVYAHHQTAVSKFFAKNDCGLCVPEHNLQKLKNAILFLINNEDYRQMISNNAVRIASELFDADKVRQKFQSLLINLSKTVC